ncbi:protein FLOWERING LOCUS D [Cryptomeria japonica]|uniref:protein FLOWERING LOCUS D n=1 Tax=Cryptomeria japonica TaxID=3369 RepID=UPI0025AD8941|nr:protein FLOWERING LOCUS D [Cryptomeria japonica]XP_057871798.1 protein FLOWERING LOCUS D [Cryptomeria japonica]XP_057871799.1 protein FLOWERING LOCUS D [Cryptomeria japonica]XP_057871800.1 protein FLOWERING LOCUS D [Cryptomeria japonica]XP_057871801.1 protein FLOWERING LOCUS D [Cryptomeria japonica]
MAATKHSRTLRQQPRAACYNESLMDDLIEKHLGGESGRKRKGIDIEKESDIEAMIAYSVGFPIDSLTEEEIEHGAVSTLGGAEQATYIVVRNHILARWRENVNAWLGKQHVMESIKKEHKSVVDSAYNFLLLYGYINFGVAPAVRPGIPEKVTKANVLIIGAGLAGLAAARQLMAFGFTVAIVEGRNRPGGRVYTRKLEGGGQMAETDLGGSVITGVHGNPLGVLARQLCLPLHKIRDQCPLYQPDGRLVDAKIDSKVEDLFNKLLDKASQLRQLMGDLAVDISLGASLETFRQVYGVAGKSEERQLLNWHLANLEYANAGLLSKLSLAFWDQDDPYEIGGDHCFLAGGNYRLIQAMAEDVPIFFERVVHEIRYGIDGVRVVTAGQVFEADTVLCTVPLGVLKSGSIKFVPELPKRKVEAIKRLGFGLLDKVAMLFPYVFWEADLDTFGHLNYETSQRGEFFLFYSYASVSGGPLLIALVAGEAAINFESMPATDALHRVLRILRGIYGPRGVNVPDPIQTVCTRWGSDPLSYGSYSHVAVGASGCDYDKLGESVGDGRVFFAGEATSRRYPATMHGAFLSGLREAANISKHANMKSMTMHTERRLLKDNGSCAALLDDLFREPDLEFGKFSILFDPLSDGPQSMSLLRVVVEGPRSEGIDNIKSEDRTSSKFICHQFQSQLNRQLKLYTLVAQKHAFELREVSGGDATRLRYLCENVGVKLVGRRGLGEVGESLVVSIKCARAGRRHA